MRSTSGHWRHPGQIQHRPRLLTATQPPVAVRRHATQRAVAVTAYLTAALLSFVPPVLIYLLSRRSPFVRTHAAQAANVAITTAIYALCSAIVGGLLAFDSIRLGLAATATGVSLFWLIALGNLVKAAADASHGQTHRLPAAFCARLLGQQALTSASPKASLGARS